jgi:cytidylate kinase
MQTVHSIVDRQVNRWNSITQMLRYQPGHSDASEALLAAELCRQHPVICLSREVGAGARQIAQILCDRLRYELFGTAIIDEIAKDLNLQRHLVDCLDECFRGELDVMVLSFLQGHELGSEEYLTALVRVVETIALKGGVVLLGRGASYILGRQSGLNVFLIADVEDRVKRLMDYRKCTEKEARQFIEEYEDRRKKFIQKMFKRDDHDPSPFDLAINTSRIPPAQAAEVILKALEARGYDLDKLAMPAEGK